MAGFFPKPNRQAEILLQAKVGCSKCNLRKKCKSPNIPIHGNGNSGLLLIGEAPGKIEDAQNELYVGKVGQWLRTFCRRHGFNFDRDFYTTNAVRCCPLDSKGNSRKPERKEIENCLPKLWKDLKVLKPRGIILLGGSAVEAFLLGRYIGDDSGIGPINRWRGQVIPDQESKCWVFPTYHPSYVIRSIENDRPEKVVETLFNLDMKYAFKHYQDEFPKYSPNIHYLTLEEEICHWLEKIILQSDGLATIDWETTGLRPQAPKMKLVSCSITATFPDGMHTIAFLVPETKTFNVCMKRFLTTQEIKLTAHNMGFEDSWARKWFGVSIKNMYRDSQMIAHMLNNQSATTSLKYQTYVNFGVPDYDSHMKKWLVPKASEKKAKGANAINTIEELLRTKGGIKTLLKYNALDTYYEHLLIKKQLNILGGKNE